MYDTNEYGLDQMELNPGGDPADAPLSDGFNPESGDTDGTLDNPAEEGGEVNGPDGAAGEEAPPEEKPKRKRGGKKKEEEPAPGPEQPDTPPDETDAEGQDADPEDEAGGLPEDDGLLDDGPGESGDDAEETAPARNVRRRRSVSMLDEYGRAVSDRQSATMSGLNALSAARNRRMVLTATVDGIENDGEALPRVVFYVGGVKVLIPFSEMGFDLNTDEVAADEAGRRIDSMLGAKIDYMVRHVDTANRIAAASRKDAMMMRRRTILNALDNGSYRVREGRTCTARVLHVSRMMMLVEVYGFHVWLRRDSISNLWVNDIREMVQVGEERLVEVTALERDEETGEVTHMEVSMKAAEEQLEMNLQAGNSYTGRISGFSDTAYFVKVDNIPVEVRCPIKSNYIMETLDMGDSVKMVVRGIYDGHYTGSIRKLIRKVESSLI